jgi:hypothetical protein
MIISVNYTGKMDKKQFRKDIEAKLDTGFGHLVKGSDKKFRKLIKKAAHLLADGLHKPEPKTTDTKTKKAAPAKPAAKKKAPRKALKKSAIK